MQDISKPDNSAHRRKRRGSVTGVVFSGFLAFALAFGLLYVLLAEAVGLPEQRHERMYADHYSGIVYLPYVLQQMGQRISSQ